MRKIAFLLAVCLLLCGFALAEKAPTIRVEQTAALPGETVTAWVRLEQNPGVASVKLQVAYDKNVLQYQGSEIQNGFASMPSASYLDNDVDGTVILTWLIPRGNSTAEDFAKLTFKVSASAETGKTPLRVSYQKGDVFDEAYEDVAFLTENGCVCVTENKASAAVTETAEQTKLDVKITDPEKTESVIAAIYHKVTGKLLGLQMKQVSGNTVGFTFPNDEMTVWKVFITGRNCAPLFEALSALHTAGGQ